MLMLNISFSLSRVKYSMVIYFAKDAEDYSLAMDLDLESNRQTPGRDIRPMEMKGGTTEDDA